MKFRLALLLLVILVGLGAGAVVFATQPLAVRELSTILIPEQGTVELRLKGTSKWTLVERNVSLRAGDEVRTGPDGEASINFFDQGIARLANDTALTISEISVDEASTTFTGRIKLQSGKVWSKLLDFLSPSSIYTVETANSVATVRGTSFLVEVASDGTNKERFYVDSHRVDIAGSRQQVQVSEGQTMEWNVVDQVATPVFGETSAMLAEDRTWVADMRVDDAFFIEDVERRNLQRLQDLRLIEQGTIVDQLIDGAEKIRLSLTLNERERHRLRERFALRKLAGAEVAAMKGDEQSMRKFLDVSEDLRGVVSFEEGNRSMGLMLRTMVHRSEDAIVSDVMWNEMRLRFPEQGDRLDLVKNRREMFDQMRLQTDNKLRNLDVIPELPLEVLSPINDSVRTPSLIDTRQSATELNFEKVPESESLTQPQPSTTTDTTVSPTTPEPSEQEAIVPLELRLVVDRTNMNAGQSTQIQAFLLMSDGSKMDVTEDCSWSAAADDVSGETVGTISKGLFFSSQSGGKTLVTALFRATDQDFSAAVTLTVFVFAQ